MIAQLLGQAFQTEVPLHLIKRVLTGELRVYGSVIREVTSGRIAGFLQEAAPLAPLLANPPAAATAAIAKIGLQAAELVQGEFIRRGVNRIEEGVGRLEDGLAEVQAGVGRIEQGVERIADAVVSLEQLGVANLAFGAVGIGVSVAGFAVVSAKIDRVERTVLQMADRVIAGIEDLRQDAIRTDLDDLRSLGDNLDEGWRLTDAAAEQRWHRVAADALIFQGRFERRAAHLLTGQMAHFDQAEPMLDALAMANGLRVAALGACNEIDAAREAAAQGARRMDALTGGIGLADLVRHRLSATSAAPGTEAWEQARADLLQDLTPAAQRLRDREAAITTRAAPLIELKARGIQPRDWLRSAHEEKDAALLLTLLPEAE